jgi:prepilin-type N-terminal cleavage/methylation domain-containing protein
MTGHRSGSTRHSGFTLIEVLIVVVIMAVLAATIIPQFSTSTNDARESSQRFNLQSLRTQLELYKVQHGGSLPAGTNNLEQLTKATDATGAVSSTGLPDATHPFGPYVQGGALPAQPFSGLRTVTLDTGMAGSTPTATAAPGGGWIYRASTGEIWVDHPDYLTW